MRKRHIAMLITMIVLFQSFFGFIVNASPKSIETPDILDGLVYTFQNENSGKYLTVQNNNSASGSSIVQYSGGTLTSQQFRLEYTDNGYYHIIPMINQSLRLDVVNASDATYALIQTFYPNSGYENAQQFKFIPDGNGYYKIMPRLSTTRVFDVVNASTANNANIQLYPSYDQTCQRWAPGMVWDYYSSNYESEGNDSISTANNVGISELLDKPTRKIGFITSSTDVDYYKIIPPRHGYLEIELLPGIDCDYDLRLYNSSGTLLQTSSNSGDYNEHFIQVTSRDSSLQTFYIKVNSYSGYSNIYPYFLIVHYRDMHNKLCWSYPLSTSVSNNKVVNSPVGYRSYDGTYHTGIDLNASNMQTVYSICSGVVVTSNYVASAGEYIVIRSNQIDPVSGNYINTRYMHLNSRNVSTGATVSKNQQIGLSGNSGTDSNGNTFGYHLHIDANNGNYTTSAQMRNDKSSIINLTDLFSKSINFATGKPYLNT